MPDSSSHPSACHWDFELALILDELGERRLAHSRRAGCFADIYITRHYCKSLK
jgi:hypothetical protein